MTMLLTKGFATYGTVLTTDTYTLEVSASQVLLCLHTVTLMTFAAKHFFSPMD